MRSWPELGRTRGVRAKDVGGFAHWLWEETESTTVRNTACSRKRKRAALSLKA